METINRENSWATWTDEELAVMEEETMIFAFDSYSLADSEIFV